MSNYRPICDVWLLARTKYTDGLPRYGGYLAGFAERARALIGCSINDAVLHVCGGKARYYPYRGGFGKNDKTLDLDPLVKPDFLQDARKPFPKNPKSATGEWKGILIDPPYSEEDAEHYSPGAEKYPKPNLLLENAFVVLGKGRKVGIIHYILPKPPKNSKFVALVGVYSGFNNRGRTFSVFQRV